jgi:2-polyprenyl-3-methyl-5-hydroxy-6-metoxy-1,4-benzoquinol methylase
VRKLYQTEWHGIPFESFAKLSMSNLPDSSFYTAFYEILHGKYRGFDDLDQSWVSLKRQVAGLVKNNPKVRKGDRILSIGCGLGLIEMELMQAGFLRLEITEVSEAPLRWVRPLVPSENVHIGLFPDCIPHNEKYDFVLLAGVEYFLDDVEFSNLLRSVHNRLLPGGMCMLISWSFDTMPLSHRLIEGIKDFVRHVIYKVIGKTRGQFWGYIRRPEAFHRAMRNTGFTHLHDGMLDTNTCWDTYWIEATKNG